ncbi:MAG: AraC family transcriptional regulator [Sinimarinibacterium sp.]
MAKLLTIVATSPSFVTMAFTDVRRTVISAKVLVQFAAARGVAPEDSLRASGITPEMLEQPKTEISADQELAVVRNIVRRIGDQPGLGLDAGLRYHLSTYGIWGFALLTSPNYRSAAEIALRYLDLTYAFVHFRIEARGRDLTLILDDSAIPEDVRQFLLERDLAAWSNAVRELGVLPVAAAQFRFERPAYGARFTELCGIEPRFGAAENSILHRAADVDAPLPQSDSTVARLCLEQCRQLLDARQVRSGLSAKVRDMLLRGSSEMPDIKAVSTSLHVAPRSLRRHLEQEGTSFRELLDEVRLTLAEEMLDTGRIKLSEIALRLGYAEPASFTHAFKRWKGVSPAAYREARRA